MSKKWTKWIYDGDPDVFPYKKEVVQVQTLPDGSIRYKRLKKNVEAERTSLDEPDETGITLSAEISMVYRNYRGETSHRTIRPVSLSLTSTEYHADMQWILRAWDVDKGAERDFALRDCNFKTATESASARKNFQAIADDIKSLKDRPETRRGPYVITDEDIDATTPKPIITGPGEYVTADGDCVKIYQEHAGRWVGQFLPPARCRDRTWNADGSYAKIHRTAKHHPHDITGPWQDPEAEKPERWENLYRSDSGELHMSSCFYTSFKSAKLNAGSVFKHIGAVLLNPEEE